REPGEDPAQTERVLAQSRPDPILTRGRGIALVEDQVDHLEHRGEARRALRATRKGEPHVRFDEGPLGPDDPLGDARDRHEERTRGLLSRQTAEDTKGERDASVLREDRMARHEDQAEQVIPYL